MGPDGSCGRLSTRPKGTCCRCAMSWFCATRQRAPRRSDAPTTAFRPGCRTTRSSCWMSRDDVAAWYSGAERIYGYQADEAIGQHVSLLYPGEDAPRVKLQEELKRAAAEGHFGTEGWQARKDGSRFWANAITMALKDENGELQGFASVVRDFSERHERDEKLRRSRARIRPIPVANRPSPASFPVSLTGFQRPMTRFSNWSDTAAKICWRAGCTGPISLRRNTRPG